MMSTTATPDGDGYLLSGGKTFITNGPIADVITVYAKLETGDGASGITAFLVPTDTPGFHVGPPIAKLGLNTCPFCELEFTDCRVPASNIVGKPGAGFFILEHVMNWEILCIFIMMAGEMQERMERCIAHVKKRTAFGVPIASNQYVAGKIVDQKIGIETSRKHLYDTARRFAKGRSVTTEISRYSASLAAPGRGGPSAGLVTIRLTTTVRTPETRTDSVEVEVYGEGSRSSGAWSSVCPKISRVGVNARTVTCRRTSSRSSMVGSWWTRNDSTSSPASAACIASKTTSG